MQPARRALLVSPYFPPRRRIGSLRAFKFATHLPRHGITPVVVGLDAPGERLTEVEAAALEGIPRLMLAPPFRRAGAGGSTDEAPRAGFLDELADAIDRRVPIDSWAPWLMSRAGEVAAFAEAQRVDLVWSTADPWSSHLLGREVARRLSVPFVADFREPWTLASVQGPSRPRWVRALDSRIEASIVRSAAALVFTAGRASARYREHYRGAGPRIVTLPNGFDEQSCGAVSIDALAGHRAVSPRPTLDLLFFGRFGASTPAMPVVRWLAGLRLLAPELVEGVRVQSMGRLVGADRAVAEREGVLECFETVEEVPYAQAIARQREADLLLVAADERRDDAIPSKLFDALPAGRPIVSLDSNEEVAGILRHTGAGESFSPSDPAAVARLAALVRAKANLEPLPIAYVPDVRSVRSYEVGEVTARLAELFHQVVA